VAPRIELAERPRADQGLIEEALVVQRGRRLAVHFTLARAVHAVPALDGLAPGHGHLGQHVDPRADIFGALGVMRGSAEHLLRPVLGAILRVGVERPDARAVSIRLAAHFVERREPVESIERRVFHAFRGGRCRDLLEFHREGAQPVTTALRRCMEFEEQSGAYKSSTGASVAERRRLAAATAHSI